MAQQAPAGSFLQDPKNRLIAIIGSVVVLLGVIGGILWYSLGGQGEPKSDPNLQDSATAPAPGALADGMADSSGGPGMPAGMDTAGMPGGSGEVGMPAGSGGGVPGKLAEMAGGMEAGMPGGGSGAPAATGAGTGAGPGEPPKLASANVPHRADPFQYTPDLRRLYNDMIKSFDVEVALLPPLHLEQWYEVYKPPRIRRNGEEDLENLEPNEPYPPMRVAGVTSGNVVAAILEVNGLVQSDFAVPGKTVLNGEFRVDRVGRDHVVLSRRVPGYKRRQVIEVTMEGTAGYQPGAPGMGGAFPGGSAEPGMFPGGPGMFPGGPGGFPGGPGGFPGGPGGFPGGPGGGGKRGGPSL